MSANPQDCIIRRPSLWPDHVNRPQTVIKMQDEPLQLGAKPTRGEETYTVSLILVGDEENGIRPSYSQSAVPKDGRWTQNAYLYDDNGPATFSLTEGVYDFIAMFMSNDATYLIVKENVNVNQDLTLTADCKDADQKLECNFVLPNGSEIQPPIYDYATGNILDGNVYFGGCDIVITSKNGLYYSCLIKTYESALLEDGTLLTTIDSNPIYTNSNSAIYVTWVSSVGCVDGPTVIASHSSDALKSCSYVSNEGSYETLIANFGEALNTDEKNGVKYGTLSYDVLKVDGRMGHGSTTSMGGLDMSWDDSEILFLRADSGPLSTCPILSHGCVYDDFSWSMYGMVGPSCFPTDNIQDFSAHFPQLSWNSFYDIGYEYIYEAPDMGYSIHANTPVNVGTTVPGIALIRDEDGFADCSYVCRDGSQRPVDRFATKLNVAYNGNNLASNMEELNSYFYDEEWNLIEYSGTWDYTLSASNMTVDGTPSLSTLNLHIEKDDTDYSTLAALQLQMRDNENHITQKFASLEDMTLTFQAGRYHYFKEFDDQLIGWSHYWIGEEAEDVKLEIAPRGNDEYTELAIKPVDMPDSNPSPNAWRNTTYTLSPSNELKLTEGWYDVRITVNDGLDHMEQVISPAFKIDGLSGVESIQNESSFIQHMDGKVIIPAGAEVYDLTGVRKSSAELSKGLYIIKHNGKVNKTLIK